MHFVTPFTVQIPIIHGIGDSTVATAAGSRLAAKDRLVFVPQ